MADGKSAAQMLVEIAKEIRDNGCAVKADGDPDVVGRKLLVSEEQMRRVKSLLPPEQKWGSFAQDGDAILDTFHSSSPVLIYAACLTSAMEGERR
jgi:hypothetical protein